MRVLVLLVMLGVFASPAQAASTLTLSIPTPDPVEERALEVTASGSLDGSRVLYAFVRPESAATCGATAADENAKAGTVELTGPSYSSQADGHSVAAGAYSRSLSYSPALAQTYRICAYIASSASGLPDATSTATVTPRRATATAGLSVAAQLAVEEGPVAITATGTTENVRKLLVFVESGATEVNTCATTPAGENQKSSAEAVIGSLRIYDNGETLGAGEFSQQEPFTPAKAGRYRLCAYVYRDPAAAPYATATRLLDVARASATAVIEIATEDPAEEAPVSVTVSGTTERVRNLLVAVESGASEVDTCASTWDGEIQKKNATKIATDSIAPTQYSQAHPYVPADPGLHRVCAYVHRPADDYVYASATRLVQVRRAMAHVSLTASTDRPVKGEPFTVTASGTTERGRQLWVFVESDIAPGAACSASALAEREKSFSSPLTSRHLGDTVSAPRFDESRPFTPASDGPRLVCAYLQKEKAAPPYAVASLLVGAHVPTSPITQPAPLTVKRRLRPGRTRRAPGRTTLSIEGAPGTSLTLLVWRGRGPKKSTALTIGSTGRKTATFRWSCSRPGTYRYEVVNRTSKPVRGGWTVSRRRCRSLPRR